MPRLYGKGRHIGGVDIPADQLAALRSGPPATTGCIRRSESFLLDRESNRISPSARVRTIAWATPCSRRDARALSLLAARPAAGTAPGEDVKLTGTGAYCARAYPPAVTFEPAWLPAN